MKLVVGSVVLAALTLSGCSSGGGQAGPSSSPVITTPTATPPTPIDLAKAQALAMLPAYYKTLDRMYDDPTLPLNEIYKVAVQPNALEEIKAIGTNRARGNRSSGSAKLVRATVTGVDLYADPKAKPTPVFPSVNVVSCLDVSGVSGTDARGRSLVPIDRPPYLVEQLTIVNLGYPHKALWLVRMRRNKEATACAS